MLRSDVLRTQDSFLSAPDGLDLVQARGFRLMLLDGPNPADGMHKAL